MPEESRYKDIFKYLQDNGIEVYAPAQKIGECTSPYVVIKGAGSFQYANFSSMQALYDFMCYVPKDHYSQLEPFLDRVKELLKGLYPMLVPMNTETEPFYDYTVKAHMASVQYRNMRKI